MEPPRRGQSGGVGAEETSALNLGESAELELRKRVKRSAPGRGESGCRTAAPTQAGEKAGSSEGAVQSGVGSECRPGPVLGRPTLSASRTWIVETPSGGDRKAVVRPVRHSVGTGREVGTVGQGRGEEWSARQSAAQLGQRLEVPREEGASKRLRFGGWRLGISSEDATW